MDIVKEVSRIRERLYHMRENPIDMSLPPIPPYIGGNEIKLVIIGQDPTVKSVKSRDKIKVTLNLDKKGALLNYIEYICKNLGINMSNVYATNLFKYFYSISPANTPNVIKKHLEPNLKLLKKEIEEIPGNPAIITLGRPVLRLLTDDENEVNRYWGYKLVKGKGVCMLPFYFSSGKDNKLGIDFFPFPHQPSFCGHKSSYYRDTIADYANYIRSF